MPADIPKDILAYLEGKTANVECEKVRALRARVARLEEALKEIDAKDTYSTKSYGPFADIARRALDDNNEEQLRRHRKLLDEIKDIGRRLKEEK